MTLGKTIAISTVSAGAGFALVLGLANVVFGHGMEHNPSRFQYVQSKGMPSEYAGLLNPLRATSDTLSAGQTLYDENCVSCHGAAGEGDGELAAALEPKPASIAGMYDATMMGMGQGMMGAGGADTHLMHGVEHHHPGMTHAEAMGGTNLDAYMFWAISEGGAPMGSAMPAFKDVLSKDERWEILLYVANGFRTEVN